MKRWHYFLFLLIVPVFTIHAQNNSKKPLKECNALLARQLVEQQAEDSKTVAETDKRVNILLRVAEFLWLADEEAARKHFAEAFQIAQERFREKGIEKKESRGYVSYQPDYRFNVINAVARRDAEWAKKLSEIVLKEFDEDKDKDKRGEYDKTREVSELLGVAAQAAKDNPNLTVTLMRRAMRYSLSASWYWTLYRIAENNQSLADQIYGELLANYANAEVFRLLYLSAYPFGRDRIFGVEKYSLGTNVPAGFAPNPNLKRQFLIALFRRVMTLTPESTGKSLQSQIPESAVAVTALNDFESIVSQQFPELSEPYSQVRIHVNSITAVADLEAAKKSDEQGKGFYKSFDERLKKIEKADAEGKLTDVLIFQLINAAKVEDEFKKAETWLDEMIDETAREAVADYFYFQRSRLAAKEKRFDDGRKYAVKVDKLEHRAVLFFDIAEAKLKEPLTRLDTLDTLLEVSQTALKAPDTVEKAQVLLGIAYMYELIDHYSALNSLAEAIKTANKLENPNLTTNSVMQKILLKDYSYFFVYSVPGFEVSETFQELSKKDFLNALTHATNFSDKYLRTLAVLATVRECGEKAVKPKSAKPKTNQ